ncbi:flagellar assembly protein FliH [Burkholderia gladioli]|uniref:flagellar assembly protein FliH n=1 Tax=Burkholderia gladioli TaxID=28095 RepID=UPI00264F70DF|nr:flagellar assembly protein FliH [Burkholderia gladioli]MDN7923439.1 flagellar assembly protein FliH [Burkholderia gladioli]
MSERARGAASMTAYQRWEMASFDPKPPAPAVGDDGEAAAAALAAELQRVRDAAHAEGMASGQAEGHALGYRAGHDSGYAEGLETGRAEMRVEAGHFAALARSFDEALHGARDTLADQLAQLALDIAQQVVRQHVQLDPGTVLAAAREALAAEPALAGAPQLVVSPADLPVVEAYLQEELDALGWSVRTDPAIERGGCRAQAASGEVDATLPTRWERVAAALGRSSEW